MEFPLPIGERVKVRGIFDFYIGLNADRYSDNFPQHVFWAFE
jgi:hypothetical protein